MKKNLLLTLLALMVTGCNISNDNSSTSNVDSSKLSTTSNVDSLTSTSTKSETISSLPDNVDASGLLILQAYGVGTPGGTNVPALSHSFVELYNPTDAEIPLSGYTLQYSESGTSWSKLSLTGSVPSKSSYLILANEYGDYTVEAFNTSNADVVWTGQTINNKGMKLCLVNSIDLITVKNPFNNGTPIDGYVDMVGAAGKDETIDGYETTFIEGQSKQKSIRRKTLTDTNDNNADFVVVDFSALPENLLDDYLPRSTKDGSWNPIVETQAVDSHLMILQIYGTGGKTDCAISHSFIELYNPTDADIDLNGYSIHYGTTGTAWVRVNLSGVAKAKHSFLILGSRTDGTVLVLSSQRADMNINMQLDNKNNKVCLLSNTNYITVADPFVSQIAGYVDLVGTGETDSFEGAPLVDISKQKTVRRTSLEETNNNFFDFETIKFGDLIVDSEDYEHYRPKYTGFGAWDPITK